MIFDILLLFLMSCRECNLHKYVTEFIRDKFNLYIQDQMSSIIKSETEGILAFTKFVFIVSTIF